MNTYELNEFIKHYIEKNKTQSAIMLSAPWGTGKSYYINNSLVPYLKDYGIKCIIVSLYGLKSINEISKAIFLESRFNICNKNKVSINTGKIVGKAIIKGVASFFGVDLSITEKDLNKLYASLDLSDKLVVLEDVERSKIDILELLGFVNNMVEHDCAKVLLVTNEDELLNHIEYLRVKEKTITDTIKFHISNRDAIKNIMEEYKDKRFNEICDDILIDEIVNLMISINSFNLRSFIFGCQKMIDIFDKITFDIDEEFYKYVFLSVIAYSLKSRKKDDLKWLSEDNQSAELGTYKYPLYKFSYDFICSQYLDIESIRKSNKAFCDNRENDNIKGEVKGYLEVIYSYYIKSEIEVTNAVDSILKVLETTKNIPIEEYGKLANYLIAIKYDLPCGDTVDKCKSIMLKKVSGASSEIMNKIMYHNGIELNSEDAINELKEFKSELKSIITGENFNEFDFDYKLESIKKFTDFIYSEKDSFIINRCFAIRINNSKYVELLSKCNANEILQLRSIFHTVYSFNNIKDYFSNDKESLIDLKNKVESLLNGDNEFDGIQKKQIKYLIENLNDYISRLS